MQKPLIVWKGDLALAAAACTTSLSPALWLLNRMADRQSVSQADSDFGAKFRDTPSVHVQHAPTIRITHYSQTQRSAGRQAAATERAGGPIEYAHKPSPAAASDADAAADVGGIRLLSR